MPAAPSAPSGTPWQVVLPVKGGPRAKSRLEPLTAAVPGLALALALDCLDAVLGASRVGRAWVVTADAEVAALAAARGAAVVPERRPGAGLLAAVADGVAAAGAAGPSGTPVAVLLADLPSLRPQDLDAALAAAEPALAGGAPEALVPDAEGTGTVLLAAASAAALRPRFGPGSAAAHVADGAVAVGADLPRLRRDADTPAELAEAVALGVGPRTAALLGAAPGRRAAS